jgi:post-segregation antitoxin (ccd killing protein)
VARDRPSPVDKVGRRRRLRDIRLDRVSPSASEASVYDIRMARLNVYVPDELAERARDADLNVSALTQSAIRRALVTRDLDHWLDALDHLDRTSALHTDTLAALDAARGEFGDRSG